MIKWNEEYQVYVSDNGKIISKTRGECKLEQKRNGYERWSTFKKGRKRLRILVHRLVWETFNGQIPDGMEIDHINRIRNDNRLCNLRCVTHSENMTNWATPVRFPRSEFGQKFFEHYGIHKKDNKKLYMQEYRLYRKNNKCSWE